LERTGLERDGVLAAALLRMPSTSPTQRFERVDPDHPEPPVNREGASPQRDLEVVETLRELGKPGSSTLWPSREFRAPTPPAKSKLRPVSLGGRSVNGSSKGSGKSKVVLSFEAPRQSISPDVFDSQGEPEGSSSSPTTSSTAPNEISRSQSFASLGDVTRVRGETIEMSRFDERAANSGSNSYCGDSSEDDQEDGTDTEGRDSASQSLRGMGMAL